MWVGCPTCIGGLVATASIIPVNTWNLANFQVINEDHYEVEVSKRFLSSEVERQILPTKLDIILPTAHLVAVASFFLRFSCSRSSYVGWLPYLCWGVGGHRFERFSLHVGSFRQSPVELRVCILLPRGREFSSGSASVTACLLSC